MKRHPMAALRRLFRIVNGGTPTSADENWGGGLAWATPVDLGRQNGGIIDTTDRTLTSAGLASGSRQVPTGSLIVSSRAPIGYVAQADRPMAFNQGCKGLVPGPEAEPRFYRFVLSAAREQLAGLGQGATFDELSTDALGGMRVVAPSVELQRRIADYLDAEVARIDELIAASESRKALVRERIRSREEERAASFQRVPLKRLANLLPGFTFPSEDFAPGGRGPRLLRGVNVTPTGLRWDDAVSYEGDDPAVARYVLRSGDLVIGMDRPFVKTGTRVAFVDMDSAGSLLVQRVCRIRVTDTSLMPFIYSALQSHRFLAYIEPDLTGVSVPHVSESQIASFRIPLPPESARSEVIEEMEQAKAAVDEAVRVLDEQLELLRERRRSLITAVVTGEMEVP